MNSPSYIKLLNLRACADYAQRHGLPLALDANDLQVFPPVNPPLPALPANDEEPQGWSFTRAFTYDDGSGAADALADCLSWRQFLAYCEANPEHAFAITNHFRDEGVYVVSEFAKASIDVR